MKVKNKQYFLLLILAGLLCLLGISLYISPIKFVFKNGSSNGLSAKDFNPNDFGIFEVEGYFNENQKYIDVEHYNLAFDLDTENEILNGDVTIKGKLLKPLEEIHFNFYDNMIIKTITLNGEKVNYKNEGTDLIINNEDETEDFTIRIVYSGKPVDLGFGSFEFGEFGGSSAVHSLSEPVYSSTWFPCNDLPTDKALADIFITNDTSKTSISNGYLVGSETNGNRKTFHWKTVYPISTYLISINSAEYIQFNQNYTSITGEDIYLVHYAFHEDYEKALIDMEDHPKYLEILENMFGEYPFIKEKYGVAEFLWRNGAMEHQTITGMSFRYYTGKKYFTDILVHELAHQWWGNAVGPATWKDVWLNEGFAKYTEALYWEKTKGFTALQSTMQSIYGDFNNGTLYNPGKDLFGSKVYNKGAWVLHMLRKEVGDETFFKILKTYYSLFKYKNASTEDFKNICEELSGKNLNQFFKQWLYEGTGILVLRYNWEFDKNKNIKLKLKQVQDGFENYHFSIDVLINSKSSEETEKFYITSRDTVLTIPANLKPVEIELDPESWLLAHIWEEKE